MVAVTVRGWYPVYWVLVGVVCDAVWVLWGVYARALSPLSAGFNLDPWVFIAKTDPNTCYFLLAMEGVVMFAGAFVAFLTNRD